MVSDNTKITFMFVTPVVLILLLSVVTPGLVRAEDVNIEDTDYTVREPIRIDGNDDFAAQVAAEGWPGDGSEGDPYVIEGYEIDGTGYGYGIYIGNTTVHFVVRNCYIHNVTVKDGTQEQNTGIYLYKVQNGRFEDNNLYNKHGFVLWYSENNIIHNNTITAGRGIHLWYSDNNTISNNYIYCLNDEPAFAGIALLDSEYNIIADNHISNFKFGIEADYDGTLGVNEYRNNTFVDVEYEIDEGVSVEDGNNSTSLELGHMIIMILIGSISLVIIAVIIHKKKGE